MTEFLTIKEVSVIGILIIAVISLYKVAVKLKNESDKSNQEKIGIIIENQNQERERHKTEESELKLELKQAREEAKEDRKNWLESLQANTNQLKNVADKLEVIPKLQSDMDNMKDDITEIKNNLNGGK